MNDEQGWRPIATAPLDGTLVVVFGQIKSADAFYHRDEGRACVSACHADAETSPAWCVGWYFGAPGFHSSFEPTHWMPLP